MSNALRKPWTLAEFLAWEERQELKYEFDGFQPVAMTGGTRAHDLIANNLRGMLLERLRGTRCRAFGPDVKVEATGRIRYPDAGVECGAFDPRATSAHDPILLAEITSESSVKRDLVLKVREYLALQSVRYYIVLDQDQPLATVFRRVGDEWAMHSVVAGETVRMPDIGIEFTLADLYEGVPFDEA
jgi:Uma2 family endonuclease